MKYVWALFLIVPVVLITIFFLLSQKYKSTFVPPTPTPQPSTTQSILFCKPSDLQATITTQGAAGNIYGTLTIKNISSKNCTIQGDNFITAILTPTNIIPDQQGQKGPITMDLSPNKVAYSQIHFPNGPQCTSGIVQVPVTFTYQISPTEKMTFKPSGNLSALSVTGCKASSEVTQLDVWSISLKPLH